MKSAVLVMCTLCCVSVAGFAVLTFKVDHNSVVTDYRSTTNGSYYTNKRLTVHDNSGNRDSDDSSGTITISANLPDDFDLDAWEAYFKASKMSDTRRKIVLEAIDCKRKGVIYHQLRPGMGRPGACCCGCSADLGPIWYPGFENNFDFATQAAHNIPDPLYLDCSYFVKHCYSIAGLEMASSNTAGMYTASEFVTIPREQLIPGDIAVKQGHVVLFMSFDKNGTAVWIELAGHAEDCKFSAYEQSAAYIYRRFGALANDTEFVGATGQNVTITDDKKEEAGVQELSWESSWEFATAEMKHPDKLNKYVPENHNGKTVFLNPGHGDGSPLASTVPNDPIGGLSNQYSGSSSAGHTSGTAYTTSGGKSVAEAQYVLDVCNKTKELLLAKGYAVIMSRESLVNNFENAARSVFANNTADIHVAVHIDAGTAGPGWYRGDAAQQSHQNASRWYAEADKLGVAIEQTCSATLGKPVCTTRTGKLTGYCYSKIPCAYIELYGVESTEMADFADTHINEAAQGLADGIDKYFGG